MVCVECTNWAIGDSLRDRSSLLKRVCMYIHVHSFQNMICYNIKNILYWYIHVPTLTLAPSRLISEC